jgi:hypothetical protein
MWHRCLVNHANAIGHRALGYEPSPAAELRHPQTPVVGDLDEHRGEFDVMPSWLLATVADRVTRLSAHPIGWIVSRPSQ